MNQTGKIYNYLTNANIDEIIQINYIKRMWVEYYQRRHNDFQNPNNIVDSFIKSLIKTAREDFLLFCVLLYKYIGMQELDVAWHVQVLATICQLHSNNQLYLDTEATKEDPTGQKHYKRDDSKPLLELGDYIISIPPGHSKTTICSILYSAWLFGHRNNLRILFATCNARNKDQRVRQTHLVMETFIYREIFGDVLKKNCGPTQVVCSGGGFMHGTTVNVSKAITGDDADMIIVDDPTNATSTTYGATESVNEWFQIGAKPRLRDTINKMPILLIQQRIDERDLTGFVLKDANKTHINHFVLPAETEEDQDFIIHTINQGDIVFHRKKGFLYLPKDPQLRADKIKSYQDAKLNEDRWQTQYQQCPRRKENHLFKKDCLQYYDYEICQIHGLDRAFFTCDISYTDKKTSNYLCLCQWGVVYGINEFGLQEKRLYLLDYIYSKYDPMVDRVDIILEFTRDRWQVIGADNCAVCDTLYIERNNNEGLLPRLESSGILNVNPQVYINGKKFDAINRGQNKIQRAENVSGFVNAKKVYIPNNMTANSFMLDKMVAEFYNFPNEIGDGSHFDFVDCLVDAVTVILKQDY